jgi:RNA polymerase sigma-70 factor (ECF subfamily)
MTDAAVISGILAGNEGLFEKLVERYTGMVWAVCTSYEANHSACEDLVQEVFVVVYENLHKVRNPEAFGGWLCQVARKRSLNWKRSLGRRKEAVARYEAHVGLENEGVVTVEQQLVQADLYRTLRKLVETLPPRTCEVLLLYYSEGYSIAETAGFLGVSPDAVKKRLHAGREMLKARVTDELEVALAPRKHKEELKTKVMAAIPFGQVAWLGQTTTTATLAKATVAGGANIMWKKVLTGVVLSILLACLGVSVASKNAEKRALRSYAAMGMRSFAAEEPSKRVLSNLFPVANEEAVQEKAPVLANPTATEEEDPEPASVSGSVIDDSGYPVAGASVFLDVNTEEDDFNVSNTIREVTDASGVFAFNSIENFGKGHIYAQAGGYAIRQMNVGLSISPGKDAKNVTLMLSKTRDFITGYVVDRQGQPIEGAQLHIRGFGYTRDGMERAIAERSPHVGGVQSDSRTLGYTFSAEDGYFEIGVPRGGLCDISVNRKDYGAALFPAIATGTRDARLVLSGGGAISGRVTHADGTPAARIRILVKGQGYPGGLEPVDFFGQHIPMVQTYHVTDDEGRYLADGLGAGLYYAVSIAETDRLAGSAPPKAGLRIKDDATIENVDFVLRSRARIHGRLTNIGDGAPVALVGVKAAIAAEGPMPERPAGETKTDEDGYYEMELALEERNQVRLSAVCVLSSGDRATINGGPAVVSLRAGEERQVDFAIEAPITIPIRVIDEAGNPKPDVDLRIHRLSAGDSWWPGWVKTDEDGRYMWRGLGADTYLLEAVDPSRSGGSDLLGRGGPVSGAPGETTEEVVIVCAVEEGGIEGVLVGADENGIANRAVGSGGVRDGELYALKQGHTNEDGSFCILYALPAGTYSKICLGSQLDDGRIGVAIIENVEIEREIVTDLGVVRLEHAFDSDQEAVDFILSE